MVNVAVVGGGYTKFGEHWSRSLRSLATEAGTLALQDAGIDGKDIEALYVGNMSAGRFIGQEHLGALAADQAGLLPIPATRCEAACASGALAFRKAYMAIKSGEYDIVLAAGSEKMTDVKGTDAVATLMGAGDQEWESAIGLTFTGLYALMARRHMAQFGTTREQLAMVSVNNHKNGVHNERAQFRYEITVEQVLKSALIADPLRLLDCSPITDGAAAVILVSDRIAGKFENPAWVLGGGHASDTVALHDRASLTEANATKIAAKKAYEQAGLSPGGIDVAEVHDCFSINEIMSIEDLGFCRKGDGGKFVEAGKIALNGEMPVNTTGGLKSIGHPIGATGIRQICDILSQLRGRSGRLQVSGANTGLACNIGGTGATSIVHILGKEEPKGR
ncbi:MAG: thiolase domain-containing protein [Candidatus Aenigmarchaeota archaeon]|nr:thiolase domain-containing protein [Candidatus Aenigmarchaeota archaeon]